MKACSSNQKSIANCSVPLGDNKCTVACSGVIDVCSGSMYEQEDVRGVESVKKQ
jgi:hypothetical protein